MAWPTTNNTQGEVNRAGVVLATPVFSQEQMDKAREIVTSWRALHSYPLNALRATLFARLNRLGINALVAQRLKRMPSIVRKMRRSLSTFNLTQMQDIAGLRAVFKTLKDLRLAQKSYRDGYASHFLKSDDDYIERPKMDGYRCAHLVFRYQNNRADEGYNRMYVEFQFRTQLQHAWATAVETTDTLLGQSLKTSESGDQLWRTFFKLVSAAFSIIEGTPVLEQYSHSTRKKIAVQIAECESQLQVISKLTGLSTALNEITLGSDLATHYLVILDPLQNSVQISTFPKARLETAIQEFSKAEFRAASGEPIDPVLVSGLTINNLRRAYPNYFLDTKYFVNQLREIMSHASSQ